MSMQKVKVKGQGHRGQNKFCSNIWKYKFKHKKYMDGIK